MIITHVNLSLNKGRQRKGQAILRSSLQTVTTTTLRESLITTIRMSDMLIPQHLTIRLRNLRLFTKRVFLGRFLQVLQRFARVRLLKDDIRNGDGCHDYSRWGGFFRGVGGLDSR